MGSFGSYFVPVRHLSLPKNILLRFTAIPFRVGVIFFRFLTTKFCIPAAPKFSGQTQDSFSAPVQILFGSSVNQADKTKQNKTKQNKTKQNKTKQNKTKQNKTKQNKTKQNKTKQNKKANETFKQKQRKTSKQKN